MNQGDLMDSINSLFLIEKNPTAVPGVQKELSWGNYGIKFEIDLSTSYVEVPVFLVSFVKPILEDSIRNNDRDKRIILYMRKNYDYYRNYSSFKSLLDGMTKGVNYINQFKRDVSSKVQQAYYSNQGVLIDSDNNLIFLATVKLFWDNTRIIITEPKFYIGRQIFLTDDLVCKGVIKYLIPSIISNNITYCDIDDNTSWHWTNDPAYIVLDKPWFYINRIEIPKNAGNIANEIIKNYPISIGEIIKTENQNIQFK